MSKEDEDAPPRRRGRRAQEEFADTPERRARMAELERRADAGESLFEKPRKEPPK